MDNKEFMTKYDDLQNGKKSSVVKTKIFAVGAVFIVVAVLIFAFSIIISTIGKIQVVDIKGQGLDSHLVDKEKQLKSLITSHCEASVYYANTFNRFTFETNQAKTYFLINKDDADKIFETYTESKAYNDVLQRGYEYETKFLNIQDFDLTKKPWKVNFLSELTISKNKSVQVYYIKSTGVIDTHTAQFPENKFGYFFKDYKQVFEIKE